MIGKRIEVGWDGDWDGDLDEDGGWLGQGWRSVGVKQPQQNENM